MVTNSNLSPSRLLSCIDLLAQFIIASHFLNQDMPRITSIYDDYNFSNIGVSQKFLPKIPIVISGHLSPAVISEARKELSPSDGVDGSMGYIVGVPPINSKASDAIRSI